MKKLFSVFISIIITLSVVFVPFVSNAATTYEPDATIYADAYMLISLDDDSYPVVAQKNQDKKKYPASLTKIVTAIVTIDNVKDLSATTVVSKSALDAIAGTGAQVAGLKVGETVTIEQLLYLTMVHSACDACEVLAEYVSGSTIAFVDEMNKWVLEAGAKNTHFTNPSGLHDTDHYSTCEDMAKITLKAMKSDVFNRVSSKTFYDYGKLTLHHTNLMLIPSYKTYYYEYAQGIKTGSTNEAGYCVITKASKGGYNYLAIVMDSPIKFLDGYDTKCSFIDAASLFDWAFDSLKYSKVVSKNEVAYEVPVNDGKNADTVQLVVSDDVTTLVPAALDPSNVIIKPVDPPESLNAPVTKGDKICKAEIIYGKKSIVTVQLVAAKTVELSTFLKVINGVKKFFKNPVVIVLILALIIAVIAYILIFLMRLQKDKKRLEQRRREQDEIDRHLWNDDDYVSPRK